tara:strand:+ start:1394 stop:1615 length:222 start_codon:yes stop_codon:yes gene_type:complete
MSELIFVTTDNCELCNKAEKKISFLKLFFKIKIVDVQSEYRDYLLRVPVLIKNDKVLVEGVFSRLSILKKLFL